MVACRPKFEATAVVVVVGVGGAVVAVVVALTVHRAANYFLFILNI